MRDDHQLTAGVEVSKPVTVSLNDLIPNEHIRSGGINEDHVKLLAELGEELPPILAQKGSMRVIDGMHRLRAAAARGKTEIPVQFVDVSDADAFLQGVAANIAHGLPLSTAERKSAALLTIRMHPGWSDRAVGRACGLSHKTVGTLRRRAGDDLMPPVRRVGLDGRERPVDGTAGRRVVRKLLAEKPAASLREIAVEAGVSPGTVRKVRNGMSRENVDAEAQQPRGALMQKTPPPLGTADRRGPSPHKKRPPTDPTDVNTDVILTDVNADVILESLRQDPSLKYRSIGRDLLRLLHQRPSLALRREIIACIPEHWAPRVALLARVRAQEWLDVAGALENPYT
ncbi:ParB N-terminal domain-containing protein [Streptomyces sp. DG1A-41]|uniref:ParB N-terminal domain-containing protein n=1 Tax=Streptomyces sp. DG1A-41 TaxID=3125779 RepID=UPI0030D24A0D